MFARVSDITSYLYCPRLCYYRNRFEEDYVSEMHAARDIYITLRMDMDRDWACKKFISYYGEKYKSLFNQAAQKFVYSSILQEVEGVDWDALLQSENYRLKGKVDELVRTSKDKAPLVLSLTSPEKDVWFRDRIRLTAFCMMLGSSTGYVYHCYDGKLKQIDVERKDKRNVLKLVERVLNIKKGFIPEKRDDKKCSKCLFQQRCENKHSTFAQRFFG
ncbi:MAG: hypothetical protein ACLFVI_00145 [Archaeoglobaceae archaeon]